MEGWPEVSDFVEHQGPLERVAELPLTSGVDSSSFWINNLVCPSSMLTLEDCAYDAWGPQNGCGQNSCIKVVCNNELIEGSYVTTSNLYG